MPTHYTLKDTHSEELEDVVQLVGTSFQLQFTPNELAHIETFGQFCDHITTKLNRTERADCTKQQAFYTFRNALASVASTDRNAIMPHSRLDALLPRKNRRSQVRRLGNRLGFELQLLRPPYWITLTLLSFLLVSIGLLFIDWRIGLSGIGLAMLSLRAADRFGNELQAETVEELVQNITTYRYAQSRRDPQTFNKAEIKTVLATLFREQLGLDANELGMAARFPER